jgi:LemA protein
MQNATQRPPGRARGGDFMKILVTILVILGLVLVPLFLWGKGTYNGLVTLDEGVNQGWSEVQNHYQRRMDLVPNLVETVKGVAEFERETFTAVAEARSRAGQVTLSPELLKDPAAFQRFEQAQGELSSALSRLLVAVEKYPDLKASQNFLDLQTQLEGTENRIAVARQRFNEAVQSFNTRVRRFPANLLAGIFGFAARPYFQAAPGSDQAPKVQF